MKKSNFLFVIASLFLSGLTYSQNPYASIGKTSKPMLSLSNGKYVEHFENDSIRQIGSAMVNMRTEQIVAFVDRKAENKKVHAQTSSRFLSIDPLARQFPFYSPYQYAGNTPIQASDLDGLEPKMKIYNEHTGLVQINLMPSDVIQYRIPSRASIEGGIIEPKQMVWSPFVIAKAQEEIAKLPKGGRLEQSFDPITDIMLGGGLFKATKSAFANDASKVLMNTEDEMVKIYRGINESHVGFDDAMKGITKPKGGDASAFEHNLGNTNSPFTSWTTDPDVAKNFALSPKGGGVVLEKVVPKSELFSSPNLNKVLLKGSGGKIVNESEVLLKGPIKEAKVSSVK